jgi:hypothetical protein
MGKRSTTEYITITRTKRVKQRKELWIGLVQVRARHNSDVLGPAKGAYFNMITWAASDAEFKTKAARLCDDLGLFIEDIEDDMPVSEKEKSEALSDEVQELVEQAEGNPNAVLYGTFHRWLTEDRI